MRKLLLMLLLVMVAAGVSNAGDYQIDPDQPIVAEGEYYGDSPINLVSGGTFALDLDDWTSKLVDIESGEADVDSFATKDKYLYQTFVRPRTFYRVRMDVSNFTGTDSLAIYMGTLPDGLGTDPPLDGGDYIMTAATAGNLDIVLMSTITTGIGNFGIVIGPTVDVQIDNIRVNAFTGAPGWVQGVADSSTVTYYLPSGTDSLSSFAQYLNTSDAWFKADGCPGFRVVKDSVLVHKNIRR